MYIYRRLLRIWSLITYLKIIDIKEGEPYLPNFLPPNDT